mgnify:CR=1 FL=1
MKVKKKNPKRVQKMITIIVIYFFRPFGTIVATKFVSLTLVAPFFLTSRLIPLLPNANINVIKKAWEDTIGSQFNPHVWILIPFEE